MKVTAAFLLMVISVCALGEAAQAPEQADAPHSGLPVKSSTQDKAGNSFNAVLPLPLPITIVQNPVDAKNASEQQQRSNKHEDADLVAQQGQAFYAGWQVWLSGFAMLLLFATWIETRKTAKAAVAQLKVAEDTFKRTVRPYLFLYVDFSNFESFRTVSGMFPNSGHPIATMPDIKISFRNHGNLPAIVDSMSVRLEPYSAFQEGIPAFSILDAHRILPPEERTESFIVRCERSSVSDQEISLMRGAHLFFWMWGDIQYRDAFDSTYKTEFLWCYNMTTNQFTPWYPGAHNKST